MERRSGTFFGGERSTARALGVSDGFGVTLTPDIFTPEQYAAQNSPERTDQPEIRLMLAVLEEAVATYQRLVAAGGEDAPLWREVQEWLESDDPAWIYSFANICSVLGFVPAQLRSGLERWRAARESLAPGRHRYPFRRVAGRRNAIVAARVPSGVAREGEAASGRPAASAPQRGGRACASPQHWLP